MHKIKKCIYWSFCIAFILSCQAKRTDKIDSLRNNQQVLSPDELEQFNKDVSNLSGFLLTDRPTVDAKMLAVSGQIAVEQSAENLSWYRVSSEINDKSQFSKYHLCDEAGTCSSGEIYDYFKNFYTLKKGKYKYSLQHCVRDSVIQVSTICGEKKELSFSVKKENANLGSEKLAKLLNDYDLILMEIYQLAKDIHLELLSFITSNKFQLLSQQEQINILNYIKIGADFYGQLFASKTFEDFEKALKSGMTQVLQSSSQSKNKRTKGIYKDNNVSRGEIIVYSGIVLSVLSSPIFITGLVINKGMIKFVVWTDWIEDGLKNKLDSYKQDEFLDPPEENVDTEKRVIGALDEQNRGNVGIDEIDGPERIVLGDELVAEKPVEQGAGAGRKIEVEIPAEKNASSSLWDWIPSRSTATYAASTVVNGVVGLQAGDIENTLNFAAAKGSELKKNTQELVHSEIRKTTKVVQDISENQAKKTIEGNTTLSYDKIRDGLTKPKARETSNSGQIENADKKTKAGETKKIDLGQVVDNYYREPGISKKTGLQTKSLRDTVIATDVYINKSSKIMMGVGGLGFLAGGLILAGGIIKDALALDLAKNRPLDDFMRPFVKRLYELKKKQQDSFDEINLLLEKTK